MKHKHFKNLFTTLLLLCTTVATAHDFEVGGIYYNILSETDKTLAVTFKGTSYYEYSNEYTGDVVIPTSVTKSEIVTNILETFDAWTSTNKNNSTTSQTSYTLNVEAGNILKFDWSVSSESNYDWLIITLDGTEIVKKSGTLSGSYEKTFDTAGSHTLVVKYTKDSSQSNGNDEGKIYNITLSSVGSVNDVVYRVTSIGSEAFCRCTGLTSIEIPNSLTSIREFAFTGCTGLNEVHINDLSVWCNIYFYDYSANPLIFAKNLYLNGELVTELKIPEGVKEINNYAFYRCINLTSIVIPNSVISIGDSAFDGCEGLTCIEIPNSVTSIGMYAFDGCENLNEVHINDIAAWCNIYLGGTLANPLFFAKNLYINGKKVTELIIPNNVRSINNCAFQGCSGLTNLTIPNSVTTIGGSAFSGCTGLTSIISHIPADKLFIPGYYAFYDIDKTNCTLYVPYSAKETYASTEGWNEFANIVELEPTEVTVTIGQYGSATYCSPYALDFSNVEGLKAYAATGYDTATQVVTLTRVQSAKGGTGLFLKAEPGEYVIPVIENSSYNTLNLLVGTLEQTTVNSTAGEMSNYKFTIADGDAAPMFYPFEDNTTFSAGKAYLQIPTAWLPATAQKSLNIRFDDGETTDIDELKGEDGKVKGICYDLSGRVVENPTSGIYIIDGKKVLVK